MSDAITRLNAALDGRYRIDSKIGEGGMATVYVAEDLRHGRKVAVKVLKTEVAAAVGADRFLAEIRTTANLQHTQILPLFDSGEADGFLFYVMPFVEGESLRQRLEREGQLPVGDAVDIARGMADALDYAHRQGVVHRDIKPGNVLLLDGKPVIADFGIALAVGGSGDGRMTETGLSLGTPHYMSPEQATGDSRIGPAADTYALGCVLYEMLAGEPPYTGGTTQAVVGKILAGAVPSMRAQRSSTPANVDDTIRKALQKLPADRFVTASEFGAALANPAFRMEAVEVETASSGGRSALPWITATAVSVVAALVLAFVHFGEEPPVQRALSYTIPLPVGEEEGGRFFWYRMSPDGAYIAVNGITPEHDGLFVRSLAGSEWRYLTGTEEAGDMFWSPDSRTIGFLAPDSLKAVGVDGGPVEVLATLAPGNHGGDGASWGRDGTIVLRQVSSRYFISVPESGGTPSQLNEPGEVTGGYPYFLPDGRTFLYSTRGERTTHLGTLDAPVGEVLLANARGAQFAASGLGEEQGHLFFERDGSVMAQPFDAGSMTLTGDPFMVAERALLMGSRAAAFTVSDVGVIAYLEGTNRDVDSRLFWVDRSGATVSMVLEPGFPTTVSVSPDGQFAARVRSEDLWRVDLETNEENPIGFGEKVSAWSNGIWAPDGTRVAYATAILDEGTQTPLFEVRIGNPLEPGTGHVLQSGPQRLLPTDWTEDGYLIYTEHDTESGRDVWYQALDGQAMPIGDRGSVRTDDFNTSFGDVSPDGRWIAYVSDETGESQVFVQPFPSGPGRWRASRSRETALQPRWSKDGTELFYVELPRGTLMVSDFAEPSGGASPTGPARPLFDRHINSYAPDMAAVFFDVSPDGERFLINAIPEPQQPVLRVLSNWQAVLEQQDR